MINDIITDISTRMQKSIDAMQKELATIRTGRASPAIVDPIRVDYYGVPTPLNQLASISAPEARLLLIQPWDRSVIHLIEKAILKSDLGLTPINQGNVIRLNIPPLTEERRRELTKVVRKRMEEARISLRNLRRDALEKLKETEKEKQISKDDLTRTTEQLQKITDKYILEAERVGQSKEAELMEI